MGGASGAYRYEAIVTAAVRPEDQTVERYRTLDHAEIRRVGRPGGTRVNDQHAVVVLVRVV